MIDGAWNHHPSLVLRNELLESQNSQKGVAFLRMLSQGTAFFMSGNVLTVHYY